MSLENIVIYAFLSLGMAFNTLGIIGLLRFPDVYTRLHATTKCTTLGSIFGCMAVILYGILQHLAAESAMEQSEYLTLWVHALIALVCLLVTNPAGAHAIARAAHRIGIKPWGAVVDKLAEEGR